MISILDHFFHYTKGVDNELRKAFARPWREQRQQVRAQVDGDDTGKMFPARQHKHAAVSGGMEIDLASGPQFLQEVGSDESQAPGHRGSFSHELRAVTLTVSNTTRTLHLGKQP
jgi:hypothetical protein